jgi:hypothetical protein
VSAGKVNAPARPDGHCASDEAWQQFSTDPRYASPSREGLTMGDLSDFDLANRQFMAGRSALMQCPYQTAAKERIRWLSVQLAAALAKVQS